MRDTPSLPKLLLLAALPAAAALAQPLPTAAPPYVGSNTCEECHRQGYRRFAATKMAKAFFDEPRTDVEARGCEACHGPGLEHVEKAREHDRAREKGIPYDGPPSGQFILRFGKDSPVATQEQTARCLQCHEKGQRLFWRGSAHQSRGLTCVTCHQVHQKAAVQTASARFKEPLSTMPQLNRATKMEVCFECHLQRRAQLQRSSHMPFREGKVTCTNCHNPHGSANPKLLIAASVNETCYQCHAERRGPFLWEHPPAMENCDNCHDPHGTSRPQNLKMSPPRLCQQCHVINRHNATPTLATSRVVFNRGCTNCHSQIHGSNHPSGVWYQR